MRRYHPGHVPDLFRDRDRVQVCSCGFLAATLEAVRTHARNPEPERVWTPPVERLEFLLDLTAAGRTARAGKPYNWHPKQHQAMRVADRLRRLLAVPDGEPSRT